MLRTRFHAIALASASILLGSVAAQDSPQQIPINPPYISSPEKVVRAMLRLARVNSMDMVYDLGCGDGRIVITAARDYGAHGVGIDINPVRIDEARVRARKSGVSARVRFEVKDLFEADLRDATVVMLYLLPDVNLRLRPKLLSELKPGTRVVSHAFRLGDWKPEKEEIVDGNSIYLWTIPRR